MTRATLIAVVLLGFVPSEAEAAAAWINGNELWTWCQKTVGKNFEPLGAGSCSGFIAGVLDALNGSSMCVPESVTRGQQIDVVRLYLGAHPEQRHYGGAVLVAMAFQEKFPCN